MTSDDLYMRRALQLASYGAGRVSPNPMVGAVIVCDDMIIGEGFHRRYGEGHAEVNAVNSVKDKSRLTGSTIYVTLEPCSHYGKTPPCAELLVRSGFKRVVIGVLDPFEKVRGRGVDMLQKAGIEVTVGVLEKECWELNRRFMTAHTHRRPYVMLKWACSADGYMSAEGGKPVSLSNRLSRVLMHKERSMCDAIMVGTNTVITDNPSLDVRYWSGNTPRCVTFNIHGRLPKDARILKKGDTIVISEGMAVEDILSMLYAEYGITSLMVEGGAQLLESFLAADIADEVRIERSCVELGNGVSAPHVDCQNFSKEIVRNNEIALKRR